VADSLIAKIDKNFAVQTGSTLPIAFFDVREKPFSVYGLYRPEARDRFRRMPDEVAETVSDGVKYLQHNTAGGRVRFATDSDHISIQCEMDGETLFGHMALTGTSGYDLYEETENGSRFVGAFVPPVKIEGGYESIVQTWHPFGEKMHFYTLNLPLYAPVKSLYIGVHEGAKVAEGLPYRDELPIVYYGSSITQGACATRPGNCFTAIISRRLNIDHINLGFSGSARGEDTMIAYLASLNPSVFVADYDHNAPNPEHLRTTAHKLYHEFRASLPTTPYVIASRPNYNPLSEEDRVRREYLFALYTEAWRSGDRHVYFIDGESMFAGPDGELCTVEGCHPTDVGFLKMADRFESTIRLALIERE